MSTPINTAIPELLAPAGTVAAGFAAMDAGADAVYAGLPRFNARERGENLSFDGLARLMSHANRHGRKVYVTLNTLIKESELADITALLAELATLKPDAVIVQDLGVVRLVREHFPGLTIHASTQMGVHNSAGARVAQQMGIERVILERQVTYEEIRAIREATTVELEIFVHGALCCSRSGVCLFSSWMGGWSGNRGRCKQPCRRRYYAPDGNGFFFSPGDLCSIDDVPALMELGVSSLKIEGRLRRVDYVRHVVQAYRLVLDSPPDERAVRAKEARNILAGSLGRKWMPPFRTESEFNGVVQHQSLGTSGLLVGEVQGIDKRGFSVRLARPIGLHDMLRVQPRSGDEGPTLPVHQLWVRGRSVRHADRGQVCHVASTEEIPADGMVFKVGTLPRDYLAKRIETTGPLPPALDFDIRLGADELRVRCDFLDLNWASPVRTQPARERPLDAAKLAGEFARSGEAPIRAGRVSASVAGSFFLPASELKRLRRAFWDWLMTQTSPDAILETWRLRTRNAARADQGLHGTPMRITHSVLLNPDQPAPTPGELLCHALGNQGPGTDEILLPEFVPEFELERVKQQMARAVENGCRRFRVTSLFQLDLLRHFDELELTASYPVPVCNHVAEQELSSWGSAKVTAWVELDRQALTELIAACPGRVEVYAHGWLPILATRFAIPVTGRVTDARGNAFHLRKEGCQSRLYPDDIFEIEPPGGVSTFCDRRDPRDASTRDFNDAREWL